MTSVAAISTDVAACVREIVYRYDTTAALSDVSLTVCGGAIVGLVGRNGAGKSTLVNVLAGLLDPQSGSIELLGHSQPAQRTTAMSMTGWLLSDPALFQYLSAAETLSFLADAYGLDALTAKERIADLMQFFELDQSDARLADELSTGNLKRLALAAALIHAPRLLVLDEPFESLDPLMVRRLRRALVRYARRGGAVLLSSHLLEVVQDICDHVYILDQGKIVFDGAGAQFRSRESSAGQGNALEAMYASLVEGEGRVEQELSWL
jgi:ABC-2 type transport system ATP-binding protein